MLETPRFIRGIPGYRNDQDGRMAEFDDYLTIGEAAPDLTLQTIDGAEWSLSDHRGEDVVVEYGSYTCQTSRRQIPGMAQLARR